MKEEVEEELRDYLRARPLIEEKTAERQLELMRSINDLRNIFLEHDADDKVRHVQLEGIIKGHSLRVSALESRADKIGKDVEDTGRFELEELRDEIKWKKRSDHAWVYGIAAALVASFITGLVGYIVTHTVDAAASQHQEHK